MPVPLEKLSNAARTAGVPEAKILRFEIAKRNEEALAHWWLKRSLGLACFAPDAYSPMLREYLTQRFATQRAAARAWMALMSHGRWYRQALRRSAADKEFAERSSYDS